VRERGRLGWPVEEERRSCGLRVPFRWYEGRAVDWSEQERRPSPTERKEKTKKKKPGSRAMCVFSLMKLVYALGKSRLRKEAQPTHELGQKREENRRASIKEEAGPWRTKEKERWKGKGLVRATKTKKKRKRAQPKPKKRETKARPAHMPPSQKKAARDRTRSAEGGLKKNRFKAF